MRIAKVIRKDGQHDSIPAYQLDEIPWNEVDTKKLNINRKKDLQSYCYAFGTYDIETTTIEPMYSIDKYGNKNYSSPPYGFMYHWQVCLDGICVYGRTWGEFGKLLDQLVEHLQIDPQNRFVFYVHNLSYEHQFTREFLKRFCEGYTVFAPQKRKPIRITCSNGIEFRCSFKLSNMSLSKATNKELGVVHPKADGDLDYKKLRTAKTKLNDTEFGYCISDVLSLWEYIKCKMQNNHDNLETIPMTSTGYVRRRCRKACRANSHYRENVFLKTKMTPEVYGLLKETARGGNTHANRHMSGRIFHDADSYDVASSYPAQMMLQKFPMTKFIAYGELESLGEFRNLINSKACLFRMTVTNLKVRQAVTMPYIPIAKVLKHGKGVVLDNGRILSSPQYTQMTLTDIDYEIIENQYTWDDIYITDMHIAEYDYLPEELRNVVMEYFEDKCKLKWDLSHEEDKDKKEEIDYFYGKKKNELNGIFGMTYTDPIRESIIENIDGTWGNEPADIEKDLAKFYKSRNSFLYYAWGVWITCHARQWLQVLLDGADSSDNGQGMASIYCDTDSCKGVGIDQTIIEKLNQDIEKLCIDRKAYYDYQGERYFLGVYEHENKKEPIKEFITLGAKKYCYTDSGGLHLTVSGVNKKKGVEELQSIDNFQVGFVFAKAGGQTLFYNDDCEIHTIKVKGVEMETASNIGMVDSTYTLGITNDYAEVIGYYIDE